MITERGLVRLGTLSPVVVGTAETTAAAARVAMRVCAYILFLGECLLLIGSKRIREAENCSEIGILNFVVLLIVYDCWMVKATVKNGFEPSMAPYFI